MLAFLDLTAATLGLLLAAAVLLIGALAGIGIYNGLVQLRNRCRNAFAQIDVQLKRRHDLIPNLVETAKAYLKHERGTLDAVVVARGQALEARAAAGPGAPDPQAMRSLTVAEAGLSGALGRLFALAENYPDLKANQNMMQLSAELSGTEDRIANAREGYNNAVLDYNTRRESFPANLVAGLFGFREAALFSLPDEAQREPVRVDFGN